MWCEAYAAGFRATSGHCSNETGPELFGFLTIITTTASVAPMINRTANLNNALSTPTVYKIVEPPTGHFSSKG
jgi:hypothetical protein